MTSNIGSEHFRKLTSPLGFLSRGIGVEQVQGDIRRELERRVSPELLNRIDEVVLFSPLTLDEAREIAQHYLARVRQTLAKSGKTIDIDDDALEIIVTQGYSLAFGARSLKRVIDERIKLPISSRRNEGTHFRVCIPRKQRRRASSRGSQYAHRLRAGRVGANAYRVIRLLAD